MTRGKFSQKRLRRSVWRSTPKHFPSFAGTSLSINFLRRNFGRNCLRRAPAGLRFALKVPEEVTGEVFPKHPRYGPRAGMRNESFLNTDALAALFLEPLEPYRDAHRYADFRVWRAVDAAARICWRDWDRFWTRCLPSFRYAVEIRNRAYLAAPYFDCLRARKVAHVFNAWTKMPPLAEQIAIPGAFTADFTVVRALLREGRAYEHAVEALAPYDQDAGRESGGSRGAAGAHPTDA